MSWEDQGRQYHMWFGHGTAPVKAKDASDDGIFGPNGLAQRIQAVAHGAVGALPQALRARAAAQYDVGNLDRLTEAMTAWSRGTKLGVDEFAERFLGRTADEPAAEQLHSAALGVGLARSHAELREASDQLAGAMQAIGLDRWPQFLADAGERIGSGQRGPAQAFDKIAQSNQSKPQSGLPVSGEASTYSDQFVGKETASGKIYRHDGYTAALLPRSRWNAVPLGTKLRITHAGRTVVVEVNDRGAGNGRESRVLDLSRAAMAQLTGQRTEDITDMNSGLIHLDHIEVVPAGTKVGPQ